MAKHEYLDVTHLVVHSKLEVGHLRLTDTSWDDLRFPAQGLNLPGAASDPDVETNTGFFLFAAASTETIAGLAQMPHSWKEGTAIVPHIHWQKTTSAAGNVLWRFNYEVVNNGDVALLTYAGETDTSSSVSGTPDNDTANESLISSFGEHSMTGKVISSLIFFRIHRIGGDASDTYGADARMLEFDLHYEIDSLGSNEPFVKGE